MSLIIKGMKLPQSCEDCPCREYPKFSFESDWCCLNKKMISDVKVISSNCPFVEIPTPHGRLIDSNELLDDFMKAYPVGSPDLGCAFEIIENAETFIKAEA